MEPREWLRIIIASYVFYYLSIFEDVYAPENNQVSHHLKTNLKEVTSIIKWLSPPFQQTHGQRN
jgi:hypothetical protein